MVLHGEELVWLAKFFLPWDKSDLVDGFPLGNA